MKVQLVVNYNSIQKMNKTLNLLLDIGIKTLIGRMPTLKKIQISTAIMI